MQIVQTRTSCWEPSLWGATPRWPADPDISIIESLLRNHIPISVGERLNVTFLAEGAFNKLYTISTSDDSAVECQLPYVFRVTLPVEPFYKTAGEVATLSYIREHTSVPVPRVIAHNPTADNELGFEWILMERIPGVTLKSLWRGMNMETKDRATRAVARYVKQLRDQCSFDVIGSLYFREDLLDGKTHAVPTPDVKFVIGPTVTAFMFAGGRKLHLPRNLGPYSDDGEYVTALIDAEVEDIKFLQSPEAQIRADFDEDLAEDAPEIIEGLGELQEARKTLFPSLHWNSTRPFALAHHDLSLSNILVDPVTLEITGIVDWECTGTRPFWEERYPVFLQGREFEEQPEPLSRGDENVVRVEQWEDWEKTLLRRTWDEELGTADRDDSVDKMRLEWRRNLDWAGIYVEKVTEWVEGEFHEWYLTIHGTCKLDKFLPWAKNPQDVLAFLDHHFESADGGDKNQDEPILNALRTLAYASESITVEALQCFDPTKSSFVHGICRVFQDDKPLQLRRAALLFLPLIGHRWFNAPRPIMEHDKMRRLCVDWASVVDNVDHFYDVRKAILAVFLGMIDSPDWCPHISKLIEYYTSVPDDSHPLESYVDNPEKTIRNVESRAAPGHWLEILWSRYGELLPQVKKQLETVTRGVAQRRGRLDLDRCLTALDSELEMTACVESNTRDGDGVVIGTKGENLRQVKTFLLALMKS